MRWMEVINKFLSKWKKKVMQTNTTKRESAIPLDFAKECVCRPGRDLTITSIRLHLRMFRMVNSVLNDKTIMFWIRRSYYPRWLSPSLVDNVYFIPAVWIVVAWYYHDEFLCKNAIEGRKQHTQQYSMRNEAKGKTLTTCMQSVILACIFQIVINCLLRSFQHILCLDRCTLVSFFTLSTQ